MRLIQPRDDTWQWIPFHPARQQHRATRWENFFFAVAGVATCVRAKSKVASVANAGSGEDETAGNKVNKLEGKRIGWWGNEDKREEGESKLLDQEEEKRKERI